MTIPAGTTPFRDEPVKQITGTPLGPKNCVPATLACNVGRSTVGALRRTGDQIRAASPTAAKANRGMSYVEGVEAVIISTDGTVGPDALFFITNADMKELADSGASGAVSIDASVTVGIPHCATNSYTGGHTIGWYDYRWVNQPADVCRCEKAGTAEGNVDHGEILIEDPGTSFAGYRWWSFEILTKAAQARTGQRGINVVQFRDTEGVNRRAIATGKIRATPSTTGKALADIKSGQMYFIMATENGGAWQRADLGFSRGWHKIRMNDGRIGYVRGEALA